MSLSFVLALAVSLGSAPDVTWEKLADLPKDVAGRESPAGTDGAWVYVPPWKGFLLFGGSSPTYSNEGWFFDPDRKDWTLLWPHDSLTRDRADQPWRVLLPRDIVWSLDRPGPARMHGVVYDSHQKQVVFFGGHPSVHHSKSWGRDQRLTRESWLGSAKLGTWTLDPATGKFLHVTDDGPTGVTRGVYDSNNKMIVAMPVRKGPYEDTQDKPGITWVFNTQSSKWQARTSPQSPRGFFYSGFTYDAKVKKCVYFNGYGETWTYDAAKDEWSDRKPAKSPPPRRHAAMCFDEARGVTILHGGVDHDSHKVSGVLAFSIHPSHKPIYRADTWSYDAERNKWTELNPLVSPAKASTARDPVAYDPDRKCVVVLDVGTGIWALRDQSAAVPAVKATLPAKLARTTRPFVKPPIDPAIKAWQETLRNVPDDTWVELKIPVPAQGCMNVSFDPVSHCLVMLGGCGGPMFGTVDDFGYNNQVWLLDMQVGKYYLRRAHHVWGPQDKEFQTTRLGPGCTRGNCFDSLRNVLWTAGGNGTSGVGTFWLQSYDLATDRFTPAGSRNPWGGGEAGMFVHDPKNDILVYTDGRRSGKTLLYDPKTQQYSDGGPVPRTLDETRSMFCTRIYDPELGVVAVFPTGKNWKIGDPSPGKLKLEECAMRTFAYDVKAKQWRDLAPKNQGQVPFSALPGVAYDSRHRAILLVRSDHGGGYPPDDPKIPYGTLWVLDLAKNSWTQAASGPKARLNLGSMTDDPKLNLAICRTPHALWVYRYKGGCPADAFRTE